MDGLEGLSRREFFSLGGAAASFAVLSGLGLMRPRRAYAVAGIDDVALGGLVLLVATLGGYAFSRSVANVSLDALGYGFSDFVSDANNQASAVTQAIADANNLGVELNRSNAENAAQSIAAGTGYFAEVMGDAATSGRVALDNFISGAGELPGVLRSLVGNFVSSKLGSDCNLLSGATGSADLVNVGGSAFQFDSMTKVKNLSANSIANMEASMTQGVAAGYHGGAVWMVIVKEINRSSGATYYVYVTGSGPVDMQVTNYGNSLSFTTVSTSTMDVYRNSSWTYGTNRLSQPIGGSNIYDYDVVVSGNMVNGRALPAVDRAADAPDVIGPGYDSLPLANDLVIDPATDDVVSAGSLPLPNSIPDVFGDYVGTLNDILAGVVPGQISLPVSIAEPAVVGTAEGVQSMSISDAIAGDTSLAATISPPIPPYPTPDPVEPPVDVPEGPWTPAVTLPFELIWPFNMIYSFVELFEQLGGS